MSYVGEPFAHDVFVTYSHGDITQVGESLLKQWSQAFAVELERELRMMPTLGKNLSVFVDQSHRPGEGLDPLEPLTDQLKGHIAASAIMAVLLSPHYLASAWCEKERNWWLQSQDGHKVSNEGRIALARIWPLAEQTALPPLFTDSTGTQLEGFWFFGRENQALRPQPYEWPAPDAKSKGDFRMALLDLVGRLKLRLEALNGALAEQARLRTEAAKLAGAQQVVYLHGRLDQKRAWEQAVDRLAQGGYIVMPGEPDRVERDPERAHARRRNRIDTLSECDALLLLGGHDGGALDADLMVVGRTDRNSARAKANRLLPCALLDTAGTTVATPQRRRSAQGMQVDWIDGTTDPWDPTIQQWLAAKGAALGGAP